MNVGIVGIGLIGGSLAKAIRKTSFASKILGCDVNSEHQSKALDLNLVDECVELETLTKSCDLILITIPVNHASKLLPVILDSVTNTTTIIDFGSTKSGICKEVENHTKRELFVASHPIAGTENTGPQAAVEELFTGKVSIICEKEKSAPEALTKALELFDALQMKVLFMNPEEHDRHIAYVSHLSHVSSFVLGKTVLQIEKDEANIFNMAGSGFASTVRLAKSSPQMWGPILEQNTKHLSTALGTYIKNMQEFKTLLDNNEGEKLVELMSDANKIRKVLDGLD